MREKIEEYMNFTDKTIFPNSVDFETFIQRLHKLNEKGTNIERLLTAAIGLSDESGEFLGLVKKLVFHNKEYDRERLIDELSDILWYMSHALKALGISLEELIDHNMRKLTERYLSKIETSS